MGAAGTTARMARSLWESVDMRLIDRPASGLVTATFKLAEGLCKVLGVKQTGDHLVPFLLVRLLVIIVLLLVVAEEIEIYFLG
jgi:hypothetical protein